MKNNKTVKIVGRVIKIVVAIILVAFILTVLLQRLTDNNISFFNFRIFSVRTGSMEPRYNVNDVLISMEVDPEDIKVGDDISYLGEAGQYKGLIITHEVIKIEETDEGKLSFIAQGIANPYSDPAVDADQIYGKIVYKSVILSFFYNIISNPVGMYICIILPIVGILGYEIITRMLDKEEERRSKKTKKQVK